MRFLFVPGTGGVTFSDASGRPASFVPEILQGSFAGWNDELVAELSCEHPDAADNPWAPTRTSLLTDDAHLTPREVLCATAYPPVSATKYEMFPYDWRSDIRHSAHLLLEHLRMTGEPTSILTHSQGGLIAVAASLMCADVAEWHELVHRVSLVAIPLRGTVSGMKAMISGTNFGKVNSDFFRATSRTWPALYQMFPQWACVQGEPDLGSTSPELWPSESAAFYPLLGRAHGYFEWIDDSPFRNMEPSRLMVVLGTRGIENTAIAVTRNEAAPPSVVPDRVQGDTLVPYQPTFDFMESLGLRQRVMTVRGANQPNHFRLLGDVRVYSDCDRFLSLK